MPFLLEIQKTESGTISGSHGAVLPNRILRLSESDSHSLPGLEAQLHHFLVFVILTKLSLSKTQLPQVQNGCNVSADLTGLLKLFHETKKTKPVTLNQQCNGDI